MSLPGDLVERLEAALLDAFHDDDALDKVIRRVGMQAKVPSRAALDARVGKLVAVVDAHGRVADLIDAAFELAPGNVLLAQARPAILEQLEQAQARATRVAHHVATPTPAYPSIEIEALSEQLEDARARKQKLREAGLATDEIDREILGLRRELREGGQLRAGDSLGDSRYLLVKPVGRGGFAVVWEAWDRLEQRRVAMKVLHQHLANDPQRKERFFRGARVMMGLKHPAVVRVYDPGGEDEAFCYFVMEFMSGGNLRDAVLGQRIKYYEIIPLIRQVGEALAEAHRKRLVHRDIKPANILLDDEQNAKLADFDLVGAHDTTGGTRTGAMGTVVYAAPECLDRPQEATARADVFGLGMTAIFCLSGHELSMATFRNPAATVARLGCSLRIRNLLERAVAWEPEARFADAAEMMDVLRATQRDSMNASVAIDGAMIDEELPHGAQERPVWAVASGRDGYGLWAAFEVEGLQQRMRWIPPGMFIMGSRESEHGRFDDEGPAHEVTLTQGYWLGETPVTQALWRVVMKTNPSRFLSDNRPVERVSWDDCRQFIDRLNHLLDGFEIRFPTEAEWERACRAGTVTATWVADLSLRGENDAPELDDIAWYAGNSGVGFELENGEDSSRWPNKQYAHTRAGTRQVGCKIPNPYGLYDMLGNVYEWCQDAAENYSGRPYTSSGCMDPVSSSQGSRRVGRGASWRANARLARAASRYAYPDIHRFDDIGFRIAADQVYMSSKRRLQDKEPSNSEPALGGGLTARPSGWIRTLGGSMERGGIALKRAGVILNLRHEQILDAEKRGALELDATSSDVARVTLDEIVSAPRATGHSSRRADDTSADQRSTVRSVAASRRLWRRYVAAVVLGSTAAAAAAYVLSHESLTLKVEIEQRLELSRRGTETLVGDVLQIVASGGVDRGLRIYRDGTFLARCPEAKACRELTDSISVTLRLEQSGRYEVLALSPITSLPPLSGAIDEDVADVSHAGVDIRREMVKVQ